MKLDNIDFKHRNCDIQLRFEDGFAPIWNIYVRWPGYRNKKYLSSIPAWKHLPSEVKQIAKSKIDKKLGLL